jgi:uncharacterized protein YbaP (TraB family)
MRTLSLLLAWLTVAVPLAAAGSERAFLWRVHSPATGTALYLAGSVHVLRPEDLPLPANYEAAWAATSALLLEVDLVNADPAEAYRVAQELGRLRGRERLSDRLSAPARREWHARAEELDLPRRRLERLEPWYAAFSVLDLGMQRTRFGGAHGVDRLLAARAAQQSRPTAGLETVADQLRGFDRLPTTLQERLLLQTLSGFERLEASLAGLISAWRGGDVEAMATLQRDSLGESPLLYAAVIRDRHQAWLPRLVTRLETGPDTLVVVGAQHLVGPDALPTLLEAKGFRVERL